ncbi:VLRF1 family aeRF1-type release factor [Salsuginibacillus kocurii]|uniref:VLRF1 family aeRF1-type release factor n=1 Tax=Salsuginibacillus kocurii TaxID=427078 RepID=UPI0003785315|nr:VLRF1 family aeRF1-type release factor [Salsuginibacillus kocurii]
MALLEDVASLKNKTDETGVLSIYLSTDFSQQSQQTGEWKILLKNGLKRLREYIEASGTHEELKTFKKISEQASKQIHDQQVNMHRSVILFASADGDIWTERYLQVPVETEFHWEKHPETTQLETLQKNYPTTGVILVQQRDVVLMDTALGEIRDEVQYSWDLESEDWKEYKGTSAQIRVASGTTDFDEFQQRFEENRQRWYKSLGSVLDREVKKRKLNEVYLIGSQDSINDLGKHLNTNITNTISKNLFSHPGHEILNHVYNEDIR